MWKVISKEDWGQAGVFKLEKKNHIANGFSASFLLVLYYYLPIKNIL